MRRLLSSLVLLFVPLACSSGGAGAVGATCSSNTQCGSLSSGYCAAGGVCTRPCSMHSDCGCAPNTTNGDIAQGGCAASCTNFGGTVGAVCTRVCANNADCEGATTCNPATGNGLNLGYSVCD